MYMLKGLVGLGMTFGIVVVAGCEPVDGTGPGSGSGARNLSGSYGWELERFEQSSARGHPVVELSWELPSRYDNEVFRVYSRRSSGGSYTLIATVTSCSAGICRYDDTNVVGGRSYDYYVATYDQDDAFESATSDAIRVDVAQTPNLASPGSPTAVALDGAVFLQWQSTGAQRYLVLAQQDAGTLFLVGETDGVSYFDSRALNGSRYRYYLASVDEYGHVSALSSTGDAFPRPDYFSDVLFAHADNPAASGFRFVDNDVQDPVVPGTSMSAQWRLEVVNGVARIQPLGETAITWGTFTTMLTCGPGSEASCVDVRTAPSGTQFGASPVPVEVGFTYVLRVIGPDNRTHYAKLRVQGTAMDNQGRRLMVFDWAYQLRPDERSLSLIPGL